MGSFGVSFATNTVTGKGLIVGVMAGSDGIFAVHTGAKVQAVSETIGSSGTGELYQDFGRNTVNKSDLIVGYAAGSMGTFMLHAGTTTVTTGNLRRAR